MTNPYYDPQKPHHTQKGFRNNDIGTDIGGSFLKWQWERIVGRLPKPPANGYRFPAVQPDVGALRTNASDTTATWIGHATMLIQTGGVNLLTDPVFSQRASPVQWAGPQRKMPPALTVAQLPRIDIVLISHNHYDHLDRQSVVDLNAQPGGPPLFLVPLGLKAWMHTVGVTNVRELDWWDKTGVRGLDLYLTPAQHWSARGLGDRFATLWGGWVVRNPGDVPAADGAPDAFAVRDGAAAGVGTGAGPGGPSMQESRTTTARRKPFTFFFAGDTGYSRDFQDIGARFGGFDLALLPIGAYEPRWFMQKQHVDPAEAIRIHQDVKAKRSIAIHWGTFELTDEPLDEPPKRLAEERRKAGLADDAFVVLKHGETMRF